MFKFSNKYFIFYFFLKAQLNIKQAPIYFATQFPCLAACRFLHLFFSLRPDVFTSLYLKLCPALEKKKLLFFYFFLNLKKSSDINQTPSNNQSLVLCNLFYSHKVINKAFFPFLQLKNVNYAKLAPFKHHARICQVCNK